jgi:pSer/pThr/pTyr-binding forkhead associated (FHA) protein
VHVKPYLITMTEKARAALGGRREIPVTRFPFNIGRESRFDAELSAIWSAIERRHCGTPSMNDLYIADWATRGNVQLSRQHCAIVQNGGDFFVVDRNSACGIGVSGHRTGGDRRGGRARVQDGDTITLGLDNSLYIFRFHLVSADD